MEVPHRSVFHRPDAFPAAQPTETNSRYEYAYKFNASNCLSTGCKHVAYGRPLLIVLNSGIPSISFWGYKFNYIYLAGFRTCCPVPSRYDAWQFWGYKSLIPPWVHPWYLSQLLI